MTTIRSFEFHELLRLWARRYGLSKSQVELLEAVAESEPTTLHQRMRVTSSELVLLCKLFEGRTGRTVDVAVDEIERISSRRASQRPAGYEASNPTRRRA